MIETPQQAESLKEFALAKFEKEYGHRLIYAHVADKTNSEKYCLIVFEYGAGFGRWRMGVYKDIVYVKHSHTVNPLVAWKLSGESKTFKLERYEDGAFDTVETHVWQSF